MNEQERAVYKLIYERRKEDSIKIEEKIRDRNAIGLTRDLLHQCRKYTGQHIHSLAWQIGFFTETLNELEQIGDARLTVSQLKDKNFPIFAKLVANDIYCIFHAQDSNRYNFIKL